MTEAQFKEKRYDAKNRGPRFVRDLFDLPAALVLVSGTPTAEDLGTLNVRLEVTDQFGGKAVQEFELDVVREAGE